MSPTIFIFSNLVVFSKLWSFTHKCIYKTELALGFSVRIADGKINIPGRCRYHINTRKI